MSDHYDAHGRLLDEPDDTYTSDVANCHGCRIEWDARAQQPGGLPSIVYCAEHDDGEMQATLDDAETQNKQFGALLALCRDAIQGLLQEAGVWTDDWNALVVELHDPAWADLKPRLDAALADFALSGTSTKETTMDDTYTEVTGRVSGTLYIKCAQCGQELNAGSGGDRIVCNSCGRKHRVVVTVSVANRATPELAGWRYDAAKLRAAP